MNILYYAVTFHPANSGYSNAFQNFIKSLSNQEELNIDIVTDEIEGGDAFEKYNVYRIKNKIKLRYIDFFYNQIITAREIRRLIKKNNYDIVFIETLEQFLTVYKILKISGISDKVIVRIHATNETENILYRKDLISRIKLYFTRKNVNKIKYISSTNSYHNSFVLEHFLDGNILNAAEKAFFVIPNTLETNLDQDSVKSIQSNECIKVVTLGRMDSSGLNQKGFMDLINAINLLSISAREKFEFKFIGEGDKLQQLKKISTKLQLDISFTGPLSHPEVLQTLNKADVVVLPSRYEGLSMFALEALSYGNLLVFANTGGLKDLIIDGENGFKYSPQDILALKNIFEHILNMKTVDIIDFKKKSLEIYRNKFSPDVVASEAQDIFSMVDSLNK